MELNAEQIIKALECCLVESNCTGCPLHHQYETDCLKYAGAKALALIKKLMEENERLAELATTKEIEKEIVRKETKADTVREMQERLKGRMKRVLLGECAVLAVTEADIKQILNESLEDK